ncbi:sulfur carrier protein ThiS [Massilia psychrophila]|uniref:Thiamine biosynthesis protein ThiS n=1 Tax=Massilia psychrophila TaxID=1603353 RepID=A0A2G8T156_9BURK|nr:sulfur carrier protein ThiS [Massilia psychrophila]PIL39780.1 thiamine biosynthesis protein ThiS [Massilia psychrophila]GGE63247.1 sulfur carrier protein ThiS [Massilia psychrophila]
MTDIILNGAPHQMAPGATLADLVEAMGLSTGALALAVNRIVVPRQQWLVRGVSAGDQVEVVHAIGGG